MKDKKGKVGEIKSNWMKFNDADYDNEDDLLQAMKEIQMRK